MNGIKYILDTNTLISFFNGNSALKFLTSTPVGISVISILEFLSFPGIDEAARSLLSNFIKEIEVFDLKNQDDELIDTISKLRVTSKIKLPDAIIAATAIINNAILITNDKGFSKIPLLQTAAY